MTSSGMTFTKCLDNHLIQKFIKVYIQCFGLLFDYFILFQLHNYEWDK
jgi:hypothetical protein